MPVNPLRPVDELLVQYARYHRDRRNIVTHFVGIPMIVFAIGVLLARAQVSVGDWNLSMAWLVWGASTLWYLTRGNLTLGLATSMVNGLLMTAAHPLAATSLASWLGWGIGSFVLGWIIQFVGHYYEGRKPAFVDDVIGLLTGPMFVVAEVLFALGWGRKLLGEIERQAGPTLLRDLAQPLAR